MIIIPPTSCCVLFSVLGLRRDSTSTSTHIINLSSMETHDDPEPFHCIICLELVYKPIVHACGHLFCFWCVHRAMDAAYKSLCPLCRRPYMHFPRICEQLHFVLLKAVREQYLVRAKEVQEEEAHRGVFSPQFDDGLLQRKDSSTAAMTNSSSKVEASEILAMETETLSSSNESSKSKIGDLSPFSSSCDDPNSTSGTTSLRPLSVGDSDPSVKGKAPMLDEGETGKKGNNVEGDSGLRDMSNVEIGVQVSDLTCLSCSKLLHRPVVLNCGHMFCEHCVVVSDARIVSCPSCKAEHPGLYLQVCLELHHYIDKVFPLEYGQRSVEVARDMLEHPRVRPEQLAPEPEIVTKELGVRRMTAGPVHRAVGCDGCGMMPIVGKRYKCNDCPEAIGYDLCAKCYESGCVVGRFNQRHTPEHQMVETKISTRQSIARQFLDAMARRSGISITDIRIIANECDELDAIFLRNSNGVSSQNGDGDVNGNADSNGNGNGNEMRGLEGQHSEVLIEENNGDSLVDAIGDSFRHVDYVDGDTHHDLGDVIEEFFGQNDEEFETFSRDDEDIEFYRVVFHA